MSNFRSFVDESKVQTAMPSFFTDDRLVELKLKNYANDKIQTKQYLTQNDETIKMKGILGELEYLQEVIFYNYKEMYTIAKKQSTNMHPTSKQFQIWYHYAFSFWNSIAIQ